MRSLIVLTFGVCIFCNGCSSYKNIPYFTDFQSNHESIGGTQPRELIIQPDDILSIVIKTIDESDKSSALSQGSGDLTGTGSVGTIQNGTSAISQLTGYLVDKNGDVDLPFAGKTHLAGLTRMEAIDSVGMKMRKFFKELVVDVRFANFRVTVMGEVARPSAYIVPNEKLSILDAIGLAGDLTIYGKRENVILMRDSNGVKNLVRLNLNSKNLLNSPYYYLRQNDLIYVEPSKAKAASLDAATARNITILASIITVVVVIVSRVNF